MLLKVFVQSDMRSFRLLREVYGLLQNIRRGVACSNTWRKWLGHMVLDLFLHLHLLHFLLFADQYLLLLLKQLQFLHVLTEEDLLLQLLKLLLLLLA